MSQHDNYTRNILPGQEEALSKIAGKIAANSLVLDVGCGSGMLGRYLGINSHCVVDGADFDKEAIDLAAPFYRKAVVVNLEHESLLTTFSPGIYDFIVVADVIEHLINPAQLLQDLKLLIKPWGTILFSVPNITHIAAGLELLLGKFSYSSNGLLDSTHVHFYSKEGLSEQLIKSGIYPWEFDSVEREFDDTEFTSHEFVPLGWEKQFVESRADALTYQWIVSTKLTPPATFVASAKRRETDRLFTTLGSRVYFQGWLEAGFSEDSSIAADVRLGGDGVSHLSFVLSAERCGFPLKALRLDLVSDVRPFIFMGLELLNSSGERLWSSDAPAAADMSNAWVLEGADSRTSLILPKNNDPQWVLNIGREVLQGMRPGAELRVLICRDAERVSNSITKSLERINFRHEEALASSKALGEVSVQKVAEQTARLAAAHQDVYNLSEQVQKKSSEAEALNGLITTLWAQIAEKNSTINERDAVVHKTKTALQQAEYRYSAIVESNSWKITAPARSLSRSIFVRLLPRARKVCVSAIRIFWRGLPFSGRFRQKVKAAVFTFFPVFFSTTLAYKTWVDSKSQPTKFPVINPIKLSGSFENEGAYVRRTSDAPLVNPLVKAICFYLPQFHEIPENNEWWGEGFTEWTNVRPAQPQFQNHYQPHVPGELGYYDLLGEGIQRRQVDLATLYGISGFCFYFYWFGGKTLLERPVSNYLADKSLTLPFCLCWANENWSRRWDGLDKNILIQQNHSHADDIEFISHISQYLNDDRYLKIDGKPLVLVYRPGLLPDAKATAKRWRDWCEASGIGEIYLAYTQSFEAVDPSTYGFDAAIEFPPNNSAPRNMTDEVALNGSSFSGTVYDWQTLAERSEHYAQPTYKLFRSVCPSWDNTARRKAAATVFLNSTPEKYERWLKNAVLDTVRSEVNLEKRLVFVNAWNEWAEGAHLEPDQKFGYAWLQATRNALAGFNGGRSVLLVTHDCHPHGAQFLTLEMGRQFARNGFSVAVLALGGGSLLPDFRKLGAFHGGFEEGAEGIPQFLRSVGQVGTSEAITSTVVCGSVIPMLKANGFAVLSLIHELPGVIRALNQEANALLIASLADKVVFPAALVRDGFLQIASLDPGKIYIRPQGLLRKNPYSGENAVARAEICNKFGFAHGTKFVVAVGYLDARKGADRFVEIAAAVLSRTEDVVFIWIGHADATMQTRCIKRVKMLGLSEKVIFTGFDASPFAYYAAASVYVLTSREDPFPNVVIEAASVGVPVVAFEGATGAQSFITENGGAIARTDDNDHFAELVRALLQDGTEIGTFSSHSFSLQRYILDLTNQLTKHPRVSVIIPNYNYGHLIKKRLEAVISQFWPIYEIIILDDASTDNSVEVIRDYCKQHKLDCQIKINKINSGSVFRQWRLGSEMASGDVLWIAEADDYCEPEFLAALVPQFFDPSIVLAYSQSSQINSAGEIVGADYLPYTEELSNRWRSDFKETGTVEAAKYLCVKNPIPNVSAVLMRRDSLLSSFATIGERLFEFKVAGDWLVYLHVLLQGNLYFCSRPLNAHRRHDSSVTSGTALSKHLAEIIEVQDEVAQRCRVSTESTMQARNYSKRVMNQFGMSSTLQLQD